MASAVRAFKAATSRRGSADDPEAAQEAEKYRLVVTAGPSYDKSTHKILAVNTGESTTIENEFIKAKVKVRIRNYRGLPSRCPPTSPYFDDAWHSKDQYSVAFSFVPKQDLPSLDTVWGNDFDHPVRDRLPPGFNTAFKIVKEFIDPGLSCDAYADEPWLYGPSLSCWFAFRLGEKVEDGEDFPEPGEEDVTREGADGSGQEERERLGLPENNEKRRKFFLDSKNREKFTFQKGRCYQADFFNPYLDFGNCALKLPGFSLNVIKYVDQKSHCLRYVFKNRAKGEVYLNVNIGLLWEEDLRQAVEAEKEGDAALQLSIGGESGQHVKSNSPHDSLQADDATLDETAGRNQDDIAAKSGIGESNARVSSAEDQPDVKQRLTPTNQPSDLDNGQSDCDDTWHDANEDSGPAQGQPDEINQTLERTGSAEPEVNEVCQMLEGTSTNDKRGSEAGVLQASDELMDSLGTEQTSKPDRNQAVQATQSFDTAKNSDEAGHMFESTSTGDKRGSEAGVF